MKICSICKTLLEDDEIFCPECGTKYEEKQETKMLFCSECGAKIFDGIYCPKCGAKVTDYIVEEKAEQNTKEKTEIKADYGFGNIDFGFSQNSTSFENYDNSKIDELLDKQRNKLLLQDFEYKEASNSFVTIIGLKNKILYDIVIPENVVEIADNAFANSKIFTAKLPSSLKRIGKKAFYQCEYLEKINIPDDIVEIGDEAFFGCQNLDFIVPDTILILGKDALKNTIAEKTAERIKEEKRIEAERLEKERIQREKEEQERIRQEEERKQREKEEQERLQREKEEQERLEKERIQREKEEQERLIQEKIRKEQEEKEKKERERLRQIEEQKKKEERERLEKERKMQEYLAQIEREKKEEAARKRREKREQQKQKKEEELLKIQEEQENKRKQEIEEKNIKILEEYAIPKIKGKYVTFGAYYKNDSENFEPLKWEILKKKLNGDMLIATCDIIDAVRFRYFYIFVGKSIPNNYNTSELHSWFENYFLYKAFNGESRKYIMHTKVDNSSKQGYKHNLTAKYLPKEKKELYKSLGGLQIKYESNTDSIFALSYKESVKYLKKRKERLFTPHAQKTFNDYEARPKDAISTYWTRSPYDDKKNSDMMSDKASCYLNGSYKERLHTSEASGIVPAMWIKNPKKETKKRK